MKTLPSFLSTTAATALSLGLACLTLSTLPATAQDKPSPAPPTPEAKTDAPKTAPADPTPAKPTSATPTAEDLEADFVKTLANVLFKGRWCAVEKGIMGEAKPEQYEIVGVMKTGGDRWVINARIEYGAINLVAPVPVQVKWAGDTPVIIVDKFTLPGAGTYSARVMIFENTYSGTWTAGDHGGLLQGLIVKKP